MMDSTPTVYRKLSKWSFEPAYVCFRDFIRHRKEQERICIPCTEGIILIVVDVGPDELCPFCKTQLKPASKPV